MFSASLAASCAADIAGSKPTTAVTQHALKVVSLAPSNTELLYAIGAQDALEGVSSYCDYPADAKKREKVGSFVSANLERLTRLKPDVVLLVSGQEPLSGLLAHNGFHVDLLANTKLSDIPNNLRELGRVTDHSRQADAVARDFQSAMNALAEILGKARSRPKVFFCVWPQPLLTVGKSSFLNDVITACGGDNLCEGMAAAYPHYSAEKLLLSQPAVIILPHEAEGTTLLARPPWMALSAVKQKHYFYLPAGQKDALARPTIRIIDGLYWLSAKLHPELANELREWHQKYAAILHP